MNKKNILAIIPARSGSKRIANKNIRKFLGKPLISYAIEQALSSSIIDRLIVDTDSPQIAKISKKYGAEVLFLRPGHLAKDDSRVVDSILYTLGKLKKDEGYVPSHVMILQTTSPLREEEDIKNAWKEMKNSKASTVLTVCSTHPKLYHLNSKNYTTLINGLEKKSNNTQTWKPAYILNGCFVYIIETGALIKERNVITRRTKAVICPKWRSVDLDTPEEWAMAEVLYKNRDHIKKMIKHMK